MRILKTFAALGAIVLALALAACTSATSPATSTVSFNLTDAPVDASKISNVYVSFGALAINESATAADTATSWITVPIDSTKRYDLLALSGGANALLGNVPLTAGTQVNQIRFTNPTVSIVETANPGVELPCTLNSASLKIVNAFSVPLTGSLSLTVDFDVGKSLVYTQGTGYKMKPVLRAVIDNEAGKILGTFAATTNPSHSYAVYVYKSGTYTDAETLPNADGAYFANAITSAIPKAVSTGGFGYTLAFLEAGTYDLAIYDTTAASVVSAPTSVSPTPTYTGVTVLSSKDTTENISLP